MKKVLTAIIIGAFAAAIPVIAATDDMFIKRFKICSSYSYVYKYDGNKALKRTVSGTRPIPSGLGCFFSQDMPDGTKMTCKFPVPEMGSVVSAFKNGTEEKMLKDYIEDKVCEVE